MRKIDENFACAFVTAQNFNAVNCLVSSTYRIDGNVFGKLHNSIIAYSYDRLTADNTAFDALITKAQAFAQGSVATVELSKQRVDRVIVLSLQGYNTVTTRARLNAVTQALNCTFSFVSRRYEGRILYDGKCYDSITIRVAGLLIVATVNPVVALW